MIVARSWQDEIGESSQSGTAFILPSHETFPTHIRLPDK